MKFFGLPGSLLRIAALGARWDAMTERARRRLEALDFWERHGKAAAAEHAGVSTRTLERWRKALRERGRAGLEPKSTRPRRVRQRVWPAAVTGEIRRLRTAHPNLGKMKIHPLLLRFCERRGLRCPSVSTIGRLIADAGGLRTVPLRLDNRGRKKRPRPRKPRKPKGYRPRRPGELLAMDTVIEIHAGIRRYLFCALDVKSRFALAVAAPGLSSRWSAAFLDVLVEVFPGKAERLLSDNGSEFEGRFRKRVKAHGLSRFYTYPKSPRMNAHVERFNRTMQEEFLRHHEDLLWSDSEGLEEFNRRLAKWLLWYNAERPHQALEGETPLAVLARECQPRPDWLRLRLPDPLPIPSAPRWSLPGKTRGPPLGPPQTLRSRSSPLAPSPVFPTTAFSPRASTTPTLAPPSQPRSEPTLNIPDCQMSWARTFR